MASSAAATSGTPGLKQLSRPVLVGAAALVLCLVAVLAFVAGERYQRHVTVLTGTAYVGAKEATVTIDGWSYGIQGGVTWIDSQGTLHDYGWPSCLNAVGKRVPVKFGEVPFTAPDGSSWRQVVWVDCQTSGG